MKNITSKSGYSKTYGAFPANQRYSYRRDLSLSPEEKKVARNMAEQLQQMEQHIAKASVIDFHKRNAIRNAIVNGYYVIDPVSITEKFLKFEADLYR